MFMYFFLFKIVTKTLFKSLSQCRLCLCVTAKLDGINKPLRHSRTMEDYLQIDDEWLSKATQPGKKRVSFIQHFNLNLL